MKHSNNFNIYKTSYYDIIRENGNITKESWYTTLDKNVLLKEVIYTYTNSLVSKIITKQYNDFGTLIETYTEDINKDENGLILSISNILT